MAEDRTTDIFFYITEFRRMFKRIIVLYSLLLIGLAYLFYLLYIVQPPKFYAASESGMLRELQPYEAKEIKQFYQYKNS